MNILRRLPSITNLLPPLGKACGIGLVIELVGLVADVKPLVVIGGALMLPFSLLAGLACLFVVMMAPAWPFAALAEKVPDRLGLPFLLLSVAATLAWWTMWVFIAVGDLLVH